MLLLQLSLTTYWSITRASVIIIIIIIRSGTALRFGCVLRTPAGFYRFSLASRFYLVPFLAHQLADSRCIYIFLVVARRFVATLFVETYFYQVGVRVLFLAPMVAVIPIPASRTCAL